MKWIFPAIAAFALAAFSLSIPAPIFSSEASAGIMNGKVIAQAECVPEEGRYGILHLAKSQPVRLQSPQNKGIQISYTATAIGNKPQNNSITATIARTNHKVGSPPKMRPPTRLGFSGLAPFQGDDARGIAASLRCRRSRRPCVSSALPPVRT